jgi:hypothetical protein
MGLGSQRQLDPDRILFALDPVILGESGAQFARLGPDDRTVPGVEAGVPAEHRGYGLVDSPKVRLAPGQNRALTAVLAPVPGRRRNTIRRAIGIPLSRFHPKAIFPERVRRERNQSPDGDPAPLDQSDQKLQRLSPAWQSRQRGRARRLSALLPPASTPGTAGFRSDRMGRA